MGIASSQESSLQVPGSPLINTKQRDETQKLLQVGAALGLTPAVYLSGPRPHPNSVIRIAPSIAKRLVAVAAHPVAFCGCIFIQQT